METRFPLTLPFRPMIDIHLRFFEWHSLRRDFHAVIGHVNFYIFCHAMAARSTKPNK